LCPVLYFEGSLSSNHQNVFAEPVNLADISTGRTHVAPNTRLGSGGHSVLNFICFVARLLSTHILVPLNMRAAHYIVMVHIAKIWSDLDRSDHVRRFISVQFLTLLQQTQISLFGAVRSQLQDQGCFGNHLCPGATQATRWKPHVSDNQIRAHRSDTLPQGLPSQ